MIKCESFDIEYASRGDYGAIVPCCEVAAHFCLIYDTIVGYCDKHTGVEGYKTYEEAQLALVKRRL